MLFPKGLVDTVRSNESRANPSSMDVTLRSYICNFDTAKYKPWQWSNIFSTVIFQR